MDWKAFQYEMNSNEPVIRIEIELLPICSNKGQMKSECIYEIINFPKYHRKDLIDFCHFRLGMSAKATKSFDKDLLYENLRI